MKICNMELNFKVLGEGRDLIILHGLFGSLDNWQTLAIIFISISINDLMANCAAEISQILFLL